MTRRLQASGTGTTRRNFVKAAGAAALAAPLAPTFLHASDKAGTKAPIIGEGQYKYRAIHDWGDLPDGARYGSASHGVATDAQGLIYITSNQGTPDSIFVFDPDGKFVKSMGGCHVIGGRSQGHGIDIRNEGGEEFIYLAASDPRLGWAKLNLAGDVVWKKERSELIEVTNGLYNGKSRYRPTNTSFSPDGGYFLGDGYGSDYIHQYDKQDNYIRTIGGTGGADGKFKTPHGHWLDQRDGVPKLVVADRANKRLQWFDMEGRHLKTKDGFLFPADIDILGELMVVPDLHCRITLLDKDDQVVAQLGDDPEWRKQALAGFRMRNQRPNWRPGLFIHPHDACFDADGNIFVSEWVTTGRVTKLEKVT